MANSMKSTDVIQEVRILPRVTASHRPGSETRRREETNVGSRVERVGRPCIEPRNRVYVVVQDARPRTGKWINANRTPESGRCEPRTVSTCWNAISGASLTASRHGGHRGRRPEHADQGMTRELARASSSPVFVERGTSAERPSAGVHRDIKAPTGKARTAGSIQTLNAEKAGTTQRAGVRRSVGGTLGSLSGS
jgi:hypothetical protein